MMTMQQREHEYQLARFVPSYFRGSQIVGQAWLLGP